MKIGSKISNRTKVLGGTTILLGAATLICGIKDRLNMKQDDLIEDAIEEIQDGIENAIAEAPVGDVIDF